MVAQQVSDMSSLNFQLSKEQKRMTWLEKFPQDLLLLTDLKLLSVKFHYLFLNMQLPSWNIYFPLSSVIFICTTSDLCLHLFSCIPTIHLSESSSFTYRLLCDFVQHLGELWPKVLLQCLVHKVTPSDWRIRHLDG